MRCKVLFNEMMFYGVNLCRIIMFYAFNPIKLYLGKNLFIKYQICFESFYVNEIRCGGNTP